MKMKCACAQYSTVNMQTKWMIPSFPSGIFLGLRHHRINNNTSVFLVVAYTIFVKCIHKMLDNVRKKEMPYVCTAHRNQMRMKC